MKKGQIATEYLFTYAWAIVAVMVAIAALWMMGVFNAQPPKSCFLGDGLSCYDYAIDSNGNLHLDVGHSMGRSLTVTGIGCSTNSSPAIQQIVPITIENKEHAWVTASTGLPCAGAIPSSNSFRGTIAIEYRAGGLTFNQTAKGDISSPLATGTFPESDVQYVNTIMACPYTITTPDMFELSNNLTSSGGNCITAAAGAETAVIDCGGHKITGTASSYTDVGILVDAVNNVTIEGCTVEDFGRGISVDNSNYTVMLTNTLITNLYAGIEVSSGHDNALGSNAFDSNVNAVYLVSAPRTNVTNNVFQNDGVSIWLISTNLTAITGNWVANASDGGDGYGLMFESSCNNTISGNTIRDNENGVAIAYDNNYNLFASNVIDRNEYDGIYIEQNNIGNNFTSNTINQNGDNGIRINQFTNNNNRFTGNVVRWNGDYGLKRIGSSTISGNNFTNNNFCNNNQTTYDINCTKTFTISSGNTCRAQNGCNITCGAC